MTTSKQGSAESGTSPGDSVGGATQDAVGVRSRTGSNASTSSEGRGSRVNITNCLEGGEHVAKRTRSATRSRSAARGDPHRGDTNAPAHESEGEKTGDEASDSGGKRAGSKRANANTESSPSRKKQSRKVPANSQQSNGQISRDEEERELWEIMYDTSNPIKPSKKGADMKSESEFAAEFRQQPTNDLAARMLDSAEVIRNVAYKSKNLCGTFQRGLKETAHIIRAASAVLAARSQDNPETHQKILEELRKEIQELRNDNEQLRSQIVGLQKKVERGEWTAPPPPRLEKETTNSRFFGKPGQYDMEVESEHENYPPARTPMSTSTPALRKIPRG